MSQSHDGHMHVAAATYRGCAIVQAQMFLGPVTTIPAALSKP